MKRHAPVPSVAIGKPRPGLGIVEPSDRDILVVKRYVPVPPVAIGKPRPGLDIVEPSDRDILVRIVHSMSVSIVNEIELSKGTRI